MSLTPSSLHIARQSVGTSRWYTMRWPQNAVSLVGRAGALSPGKTYKLMRALRNHALNYLDQLWMLASDCRHAKDDSSLRNKRSGPFGAAALQGRGDRGRKERGPPS